MCGNVWRRQKRGCCGDCIFPLESGSSNGYKVVQKKNLWEFAQDASLFPKYSWRKISTLLAE